MGIIDIVHGGYINQLETGGGHFAKGVQKKEYEIASRHDILCVEWNPFDSIPDSLFWYVWVYVHIILYYMLY